MKVIRYDNKKRFLVTKTQMLFFLLFVILQGTTAIYWFFQLELTKSTIDHKDHKISQLISTIENLQEENSRLYRSSNKLMQKIQKLSELKATYVTVTTYNSVPEQTDNTPKTTAFNKKVGPGTIAISRDLFLRGWTPGEKLWLEGLGVYKISDIMNKRFTHRVDIWIPKNMKHFKEEKVLAVVLNRGIIE